MEKPNLLYVSWITPGFDGGACLAMHRHFDQHDDFDLLVASSNRCPSDKHGFIPIPRPPLLARLSHTRYTPFARQFQILAEPYLAARTLEKVARKFKPRAIFTVADPADSWIAYLLARRLKAPLISNFQDWWPESRYAGNYAEPFPFVRKIMAGRFRRIYHASKLAFCTSPGMKEFLGAHPNAHVLFPSGAPREKTYLPDFSPPQSDRPLKIIYAGQIKLANYGKQLLELARLIRSRNDLSLEVYGPNPACDKTAAADLAKLGVYKGLLPYEELKIKLRAADVLLSIMAFEGASKTWMSTSFTTKILDYVQCGKPVVIWGPEYTSPVRVARETQFAIAVDERNPESVVNAVVALKDKDLWSQYAKKAWESALGMFNHEVIHNGFRGEILRLLGQNTNSRDNQT